MSTDRVVAIVPAAGVGTRFGTGTRKTFHSLLGKPLLIWSLEVLASVAEIGTIIPVVREEDRALTDELVARYAVPRVDPAIAGGKERQDSVRNGLRHLGRSFPVVLIHDGARPLVDGDLVKRLISAIDGADGAIAAVPVKDTIKEARPSGDEIVVSRTLDRDLLWSVQTPQVFRHGTLLSAYEKATADDYYATDDAALVERYGGTVRIVMGSYRNIKVTTPEDVLIAEAFLKSCA